MTIHRERVARKRHACDRCTDPILPGQRYWSCSLPPGDVDVGNTNWWHSKAHLIPGCVEWAMRPGEVAHDDTAR